MRETIYLIANRRGIEKMTKRLPEIKKGQIPIKLTVEVEQKAFTPPTVEKSVFIEDWKKGIDIEDVNFEKNIITDEEAEIIRNKRLDKMKQILTQQGYTINDPEEGGQDE